MPFAGTNMELSETLERYVHERQSYFGYRPQVVTVFAKWTRALTDRMCSDAPVKEKPALPHLYRHIYNMSYSLQLLRKQLSNDDCDHHDIEDERAERTMKRLDQAWFAADKGKVEPLSTMITELKSERFLLEQSMQRVLERIDRRFKRLEGLVEQGRQTIEAAEVQLRQARRPTRASASFFAKDIHSPDPGVR
jgi:hypothetical protein